MKVKPEFSIFMMPSGKAYEKLGKIISKLSKEYNAPCFEPHVTLLGKIFGPKKEIIRKTSGLSNLIKPFEIKLSILDFLDEYYRCLFLRAEQTPEIMKANQNAREIFGHQNDPEFLPHLSLLYGNFDSQIKKKIIQELGNKINTSFRVNSLDLHCIKERPINWEKVKKFRLG